MPDRKKVIKGLECCVWEDPEVSHDCEHCPYIDRCCTENEGIGVPVMRDALALLKEQDNCENCAIAIEDRQPVVRCKDCKQGEQSVLPNRHLWCRIHEFYREPDWFCADGERK